MSGQAARVRIYEVEAREAWAVEATKMKQDMKAKVESALARIKSETEGGTN